MVFFGYVGNRNASEVLKEALLKLQSLGYDSVGVGIIDESNIQIRKKVGHVRDLITYIAQTPMSGNRGIAHLRWATHGSPSDANAHPHLSNNGKLALVHNGVIENEAKIRKQLIKKGYKFTSETDSEVLVNLIQDVMETSNVSLSSALPLAFRVVRGACGVLVVSSDEPDTILAAQTGSPLLLGLGNGENYITSDSRGFPPEITNIIRVHNGEYVVLRSMGFEIKTFDEVPVVKEIEELKDQVFVADKEGFPDFIIKEIMEQPQALRDCLRGRLNMLKNDQVQLGGLGDVLNGVRIIDRVCNASRIIVVASGSSYSAALLGKYLIESLARIHVEVVYASEFKTAKRPLGDYPKPPILVAISNSGETGDVVAAVKIAKARGILTLGIVNSTNSTLSNLTDAGIFTRGGQEFGVTSTKSFTLQIAVLAMMAIVLGRHSGKLSKESATEILTALEKIPDEQEKFLNNSKQLFEDMAKTYRYATNFLYLGRGFNYPVAVEGALKLTQMSYIHCEAYPAAEMKHGPIALIDEFMPVLFIATQDAVYDKVVSNIREVKARKGAVIAIATENNHELDQFCDFVIHLPNTHDCLLPLLTALPVQLLAYHLGVARKCSIDHPRHQAKYFANN